MKNKKLKYEEIVAEILKLSACDVVSTSVKGDIDEDEWDLDYVAI